MKSGRADTVVLTKLCQSLRTMRLPSPSGELEDLERSLARLGQLVPVLVYEHDAQLEVIDGFKRLCAAQKLGWASISICRLDVTATGAKVRLWQSNLGTGLSEMEEAWLVRSLHRQDKLEQVQIGQLFGRHKSWVNRRLLLAESLCEEAQADVRLGLLSATSARELCRLPRGNQAQVARVVTRGGLTRRQTVQLVDAVLSARDDEVDPERLWQRLQPAADGEAVRPRCKRTPGEWIVSDATSVQRLCGRLQARLLERSLSSLGPEAEKRCGESLRELQAALGALCQTVDRALKNEVRHGDAA